MCFWLFTVPERSCLWLVCRKQDETARWNSRTAVKLADWSHQTVEVGGGKWNKTEKELFPFSHKRGRGGGWGRMGYTCGSTWFGIMAISFKRMMSPQVHVSSNYIPAVWTESLTNTAAMKDFCPGGGAGILAERKKAGPSASVVLHQDLQTSS